MSELKTIVRQSYRLEFPEDIQYVKQLLADAGFTASDYDIASAYAEWSEDVYCASWMDKRFFSARDVPAFVRDYFVEKGNP